MKKHVSVRIEKEILDHIEENPLYRSLAEWVNYKYPEIEMKEQKLLNRIKEIDSEKEKLLQSLSGLREKEETVDIPEPHRKALVDDFIPNFSRENIDKHAVLKRWNNTFGYSMTMKQFRILIDKVKKGD